MSTKNAVPATAVVREVAVKSWKELPDNADVEKWVSPSSGRRYLRWLIGDDEKDALFPTIVYHAPDWVWVLLSKELNKARQEAINAKLL